MILSAGWAILLAWQLNPLARIFPTIHPKHRSTHLLALQQNLDRLGGSYTRNRPYYPVQNSRRITGWRSTWERHLREDTAKAGCITGNNIHRHAIGCNHTAIDPGALVFDTYVVEEVTCLKVICCIKNQVRISYQRLNPVCIDIFNQWLDRCIAIDTTQFLRSCDSFGETQ